MTVRFDADRHLYFNDAGELVPNVTRMIAALGLVDTSHFTKEARDRGTHVHYAVHLYLRGVLDEETIHPPWRGHVDAAIKFVQDSGADRSKIETEVRVHDQVLGVCGTADAFLPLFGSDSVADWKSGVVGRTTGIQTALYDIARPLLSGRRRRRFGVQLRADGKYRMVDIDREMDPTGADYHEGRAMVALYRRYIWEREKHELIRSAA